MAHQTCKYLLFALQLWQWQNVAAHHQTNSQSINNTHKNVAKENTPENNIRHDLVYEANQAQLRND